MGQDRTPSIGSLEQCHQHTNEIMKEKMAE